MFSFIMPYTEGQRPSFPNGGKGRDGTDRLGKGIDNKWRSSGFHADRQFPQAGEERGFLEEMGETQIDDLVKKYIPVSWKYRIKALIKPVLYKTGTLDRIKQLRSRLIRS